MNNPMLYTDPSGYTWGIFKPFVKAWDAMWDGLDNFAGWANETDWFPSSGNVGGDINMHSYKPINRPNEYTNGGSNISHRMSHIKGGWNEASLSGKGLNLGTVSTNQLRHSSININPMGSLEVGVKVGSMNLNMGLRPTPNYLQHYIDKSKTTIPSIGDLYVEGMPTSYSTPNDMLVVYKKTNQYISITDSQLRIDAIRNKKDEFKTKGRIYVPRADPLNNRISGETHYILEFIGQNMNPIPSIPDWDSYEQVRINKNRLNSTFYYRQYIKYGVIYN